jgi:hypothetical protein
MSPIPPHCQLAAPLKGDQPRRIERLTQHYSALGVTTLFEHLPRLETYLSDAFDDKLTSEVCPPFITPQPPYTDTGPIQLAKAMANQRAIHTTASRQDVLQYLQPSKDMELGIAIPSSLPQGERGLESHITARFLIPRQHLNTFENDPARSVQQYI